MLGRCAKWCYGASLFTLPLVGIGVLKLLTGRDWGGGLQPSWVFLALAMVFQSLDRARSGDLRGDLMSVLPGGPRRRLSLWLAAVLGAVLLSLAGIWQAPASVSVDEAVARFWKQVVQLGIMLCFLLWSALWTRGRPRWSWTLKLLLAGGLFQFGYGVLQGADYYIGVPGFQWLERVFTSNPAIFSGSGELYLGDAFRNIPRLRGTVCEPLYLGNYLLLLLPLTLVVEWSPRNRALVGAAFLALLLGTWSRGAWLGLMIEVFSGALLLLILRGRTGGLARVPLRGRPLWWAGGFLALFLALPLLGAVIGWDALQFPYRRLVQTFSGQDWSNLTRLYSMQAAWRAFLLSPLVGVGWGQFTWHFPVLVDPMGLQSQFSWPVVNNFPLKVLCETGLVGFTVFLLAGGGLVRTGIRQFVFTLRSNAGSDGIYLRKNLVAVFIAVSGVWFQLLTFSQYNLPHIWVAVGLAIAAATDVVPGNEHGEETA